MLRTWVAAIAAALGVFACGLIGGSGGFHVDDVSRQKLTVKYEGREYVLASSMYVAPFFGAGDRLLVESRPADILEFRDTQNEIVPVAPFSGEVLYAGTPVKVTEIVYPRKSTVVSKQALIPDAHTWVVLERTDEPSLPLVMVLPKDVSDAKEFKNFMRERLASMQWVSSYLGQRNADILDAIYRKEIVEGMSRSDMFAALGAPRNSADLEAKGVLDYTADYGDLQVVVSGNSVTQIRSLKAEAELVREKAAGQAEEARRKAEEQQRLEEAEAAKRETEEEAARDARAAQLAAQVAEAELAGMKAQKVAAAEREKALSRVAAAKSEVQKEMDRVSRDLEATRKRHQNKLDRLAAQLETTKKSQANELARAEADISAARDGLDKARVPRGGKVAPGTKGIRLDMKMRAVSSGDVRKLGLSSTAGVYAISVTAGGGAEKAGIRADDVILTFDGQDLSGPKQLALLAVGASADRKLYVEVWRDGNRHVKSFAPAGGKVDAKRVAAAQKKLDAAETRKEKLTTSHTGRVQKAEKDIATGEVAMTKSIGKLEASAARLKEKLQRIERSTTGQAGPSSVPPVAKGAASPAGKRQLGLQLRSLKNSDKKTLKASSGVVVVAVKPVGAGRDAGIKKNDVIVSYNGSPVTNTKQLALAAASAPTDRRVYIEVLRGGEETVLALAPPGQRKQARATPKSPPKESVSASKEPAKPAAKAAPAKSGPKKEKKAYDPLADRNRKRKNNRHLMPVQAPEKSTP